MQALHENESPQPAMRLVSTKGMSRQDWLAVRKQGIGSSDAAAAVGLNPYLSQLELWLIKTGRDSNLPKVDPADDESPMYWGNLLEPVVAASYAKRTGNRVRRVNSVLQHPSLPWMLANLDREVIGSKEVSILECKTAGINGARLWRDGVPEYVQLQVQHQLAVTGKQAADVAVLLGGQDLQIHRINRDQAVIDRLIELELRFWLYVESDTPPPADGSDSASMALQALYPDSSGGKVDFRADTDLNATFSDWLAIKALRDQLADDEAKFKARLQQAMGEASIAEFEHGAVSWKKSKDSVGLDADALLRDHPELLEKYPKVRRGSRRFIQL